jgi:hypothetical protein
MLLSYICFICRMREFPFLGLLPEVFLFSGRSMFSVFAAISFEILKTRKLE